MSERLTSTGTTPSSSWLELAFPAALILIALFCQYFVWLSFGITRNVDSVVPPNTPTGFTGAAVLFALQCGAILRGMLPAKAPLSHKALTAVLGALAASYPIAISNVNDLVPWILALAAWNFFWELEGVSLPAKLFSGCCAGFACSLEPTTVVVAAPLLILNSTVMIKQKGKSLFASIAWEIGLILGLLPFVFKGVSLPSWSLQDPKVEPVLQLLADVAQSIQWVLLPFLLLGLFVAALQARKTLFGLFLPLVVGLSVILLASPTVELPEMIYVPIALLSAYGLFRIARGVEQGIRNSSPAKAKSVLPVLTLVTLLSYSGWLVTLCF